MSESQTAEVAENHPNQSHTDTPSATLGTKEPGRDRGQPLYAIDEDVSPDTLPDPCPTRWYEDISEPTDIRPGGLHAGVPVLGPHFLRSEW